jgi:hypothetical protein
LLLAEQNKKNDGEISELVNADGSMVGKSTPILQLDMHPRKTMDQTVVATRQTNNPMVRGYRVYYGESEEKDDEKMLDEYNLGPTFAYDETEDVSTYDDADEVLVDLGIEDPFERHERLEVLGFDPQLDKQLKQEKKRGQCKNCFTKRRLSELENQKMVKMIDEILLDKKHNSKDVLVKSKDDDEEKSPISKILMRNIESIKKIAEREGLSLNKLIKHFKESE